MSMALQFDDEAPLADPDTVKMPESSAHRRVVDLIGLAAATLVGPDHRIFRDMNWYPADGGGPIAPDVMVLAAGAIEAEPKSYRQDRGDGPPPIAVVEVPSDSDSFASLLAKAQRYQSLDTVTYLVVIDTPTPTVLRLAPGDGEPRNWVDRPMPELGGVRLVVDGGQLGLITPTGVRAGSDADLVVGEAAVRAAAEQRIAELERQLVEGDP